MIVHIMKRPVTLAVLVFVLAFSVRILLFLTVYGALGHGSGALFGSCAVGICAGDGMTFHPSEQFRINAIPNNRTGDFRQFYKAEGRKPFTEFLPGSAVLLAGLWKLVPVFNFAPYIIFQILVDSVLVALFLLVFWPFGSNVAVINALLMAVNLPVIKRTLTMGYDFWAQFGVLVIFIGTVWVIHKRKHTAWYVLVGLLCAVVAWFRSITVFLPFFVVFFAAFILKKQHRLKTGLVVLKTMSFITPVVVSLLLLSAYRHETTGSWRPTRSTFWHSFFAGVGQFSNPYGLVDDDRSIWEFGKRLNPDLEQYTWGEMERLPESPYEQTLRQKAREFVSEHPGVFLRNIIFRAGIMISPLLYSGGDFVPGHVAKGLFPLGLIMLPLWFLGIWQIHRDNKWLFWLTISVYLYFTVAFGWFYLVGRVILPFMFIATWIYVNGVKFLTDRYATRSRDGGGKPVC